MSFFFITLNYWELRPDFINNSIESWIHAPGELRISSQTIYGVCGECGGRAYDFPTCVIHSKTLLLHFALKVGNINQRELLCPGFPWGFVM